MLRNRMLAGGGLCALLLAIAGLGTPAYADAVGDGFASAQSSIVSTITTYGIPLVIAVVLAGIGLVLLVKLIRKGARAA